eukprot:scaffold47951_cov54-Phaeocystis_antarctica.AAC.3
MSCPARVEGLAAEGGSRGAAFLPRSLVKNPGLAVALAPSSSPLIHAAQVSGPPKARMPSLQPPPSSLPLAQLHCSLASSGAHARSSGSASLLGTW